MSVTRSKTISLKERPEVVVIAGPTAAGKSALALDLARRLDATIINADASQVYADVPILSAAPSTADRAQVPHALYGTIDGADACNAARWAALAANAIDGALAVGRLPIVVGGTGLYLRTLLDGIAPVPAIDPEVRERARALDTSAARAALEQEDPAAAARLAPADRQRILRALEVVRSTGTTLGDWHAATPGGIAATHAVHGFVVDLPRPELHARLDARLDGMIAAGAVEEAARLDARDLPPASPVLKTLGAAAFAAVARGEIDLAVAIAMVSLDTRHYAKRQSTWFRNQTPVWVRTTSPSEVLARLAQAS